MSNSHNFECASEFQSIEKIVNDENSVKHISVDLVSFVAKHFGNDKQMTAISMIELLTNVFEVTNLNIDKIIAMCKLLVWFFYIDDFIEDSEIEKCQHWLDISSYLKNGIDYEFDDGDRWEQSFEEIWSFLKCNPPCHLKFIADILLRYFRASLLELTSSEQFYKLSTTEMIDFKIDVVGSSIVNFTIEYCLGIDMGETNFDCEFMSKLLKTTGKCLFLINDLYSFKKDTEQNKVECNFVNHIMISEKLTVDEAFKYVSEQLADTEYELNCLISGLSDYHVDYPDKLREFLFQMTIYYKNSIRFS